MRRRIILAATFAAPFVARAEGSWPSRPVRIVVPFNPGGAFDAMVRVLGDSLTPRLGQQVLVDELLPRIAVPEAELVAERSIVDGRRSCRCPMSGGQGGDSGQVVGEDALSSPGFRSFEAV